MEKKVLNQIIKDLVEVRGETSLKISDEVLFIQACTYERGEIANSKTPVKPSHVGKSGSPGKSGDVNESDVPTQKQIKLATKKQLDYLHGLGVSIIGMDKLTTLEADKLIQENRGKVRK